MESYLPKPPRILGPHVNCRERTWPELKRQPEPFSTAMGPGSLLWGTDRPEPQPRLKSDPRRVPQSRTLRPGSIKAGVVPPVQRRAYFSLNRLTRPAVSTIFCLPV